MLDKDKTHLLWSKWRLKSVSVSLWRSLSLQTLFIIILISPGGLFPRTTSAFPTLSTRDCDWSGIGSPNPHEVQSLYLRCTQGRITWEKPIGGLRVSFLDHVLAPSSQSPLGQRLCLAQESSAGVIVYLEQDGDEERRLLPFTPSRPLPPGVSPAPEDSNCYFIGPRASLYIESTDLEGSSTSSPVNIAYEIRPTRARSSLHYSDDEECRPCSDEELLSTFCTADIVARGSLVAVKPSSLHSQSDSLYILADNVLHQNYQVFSPLGGPLSAFTSTPIRRFNSETPQGSPKGVHKPSPSGNGVTALPQLGGIIAHPKKCGAIEGPGEFLWLSHLSLGTPRLSCVAYWDRWVDLASSSSHIAECPLTY